MLAWDDAVKGRYDLLEEKMARSGLFSHLPVTEGESTSRRESRYYGPAYLVLPAVLD